MSKWVGGLFEQRVKGRDSRGHGLGLAFVEAVIRVHGGTVTATNRAEGGARFSIALPMWKAGQEEGLRPLALIDG
jgi:signal transduction histidine kinase